jgi:hypothetical protein
MCTDFAVAGPRLRYAYAGLRPCAVDPVRFRRNEHNSWSCPECRDDDVIMSIYVRRSNYVSRRNSPLAEDSIWRETPLAAPEPPRALAPRAAAPVPRAPAHTRTAKQEWSHLRKGNPANCLLPAGRAWIQHLPSAVRPVRLSAQFPRIVNLLALEWDTDSTCRALLDSLVFDQRKNRQGFPADVYLELQALRNHYYEEALTLQH